MVLWYLPVHCPSFVCQYRSTQLPLPNPEPTTSFLPNRDFVVLFPSSLCFRPSLFLSSLSSSPSHLFLPQSHITTINAHPDTLVPSTLYTRLLTDPSRIIDTMAHDADDPTNVQSELMSGLDGTVTGEAWVVFLRDDKMMLTLLDHDR